MATEDKKPIPESELNAEGGIVMQVEEYYTLTPDFDALDGGQRQRVAGGRTELVAISDAEANKVSAGMIAGLEEISEGALKGVRPEDVRKESAEALASEQLYPGENPFAVGASDVSNRLL